MNWIKLKEKFPNSYDDIMEYSKKTNTTGRTCLYRFLKSKGYPDNYILTKHLKEYEAIKR